MVSLSMTRLNVLQAISEYEQGETFTSAAIRNRLPGITSQQLSNHLSDLMVSGAVARVGQGKYKYLDHEVLMEYINIEYETNSSFKGLSPTFLMPDSRVKEVNGAVQIAEALKAAGIPLYRWYRSVLNEYVKDSQRQLNQLKVNARLRKIGRKHARHTLSSVPRVDIEINMKEQYPNSWQEQMDAYDKFMRGE